MTIYPTAWIASSDEHGAKNSLKRRQPFANGSRPITIKRKSSGRFYKKGSGTPSITWPESVDEALCAGWIDGVRKTIDDQSYMIRFSPRKPESIWSAVNIRNVVRLKKEKRLTPAGLKAFAARKENRSGIYAYEQRPVEMVEPYASRFKKNKAAWKFFQVSTAVLSEDADVVHPQHKTGRDEAEAARHSA